MVGGHRLHRNPESGFRWVVGLVAGVHQHHHDLATVYRGEQLAELGNSKDTVADMVVLVLVLVLVLVVAVVVAVVVVMTVD
jgi:hypothetical protein